MYRLIFILSTLNFTVHIEHYWIVELANKNALSVYIRISYQQDKAKLKINLKYLTTEVLLI